MKPTLLTLAAFVCACSSAYAEYTLPDGLDRMTIIDHAVLNSTTTDPVGLNNHALTAQDSWKMELSFTITGAANQWGTTLLATGSNPYANDYTGGFQIRYNNGTSNNNGKLFLKYAGDDANILTVFETIDFSSQSADNPLTVTMTLGYNADTKSLMVLEATAGEKTLASPVGVTLNTPVAFDQLSVNGAASLPDGSSTTVTLLAPEPSSTLLAALAPVGLLLRRRRRCI